MSRLTTAQEVWLREHFGDRLSIDLLERKIYSHDVGVMPPLVKPLIGKSIADGVVQPKNVTVPKLGKNPTRQSSPLAHIRSRCEQRAHVVAGGLIAEPCRQASDV
jgi:hypothetical protein